MFSPEEAVPHLNTKRICVGFPHLDKELLLFGPAISPMILYNSYLLKVPLLLSMRKNVFLTSVPSLGGRDAGRDKGMNKVREGWKEEERKPSENSGLSLVNV